MNRNDAMAWALVEKVSREIPVTFNGKATFSGYEKDGMFWIHPKHADALLKEGFRYCRNARGHVLTGGIGVYMAPGWY